MYECKNSVCVKIIVQIEKNAKRKRKVSRPVRIDGASKMKTKIKMKINTWMS